MTYLRFFVLFMFFIQITATGHRFDYTCPTNHVLAVCKHDEKEIGMNPLPPIVCGETRQCIYTKGPACLAKGQYLSAVTETDGRIECGCCQLMTPIQDHQGDDCREILIETDDRNSVSHARPPPIPHGGGGGGPHGPGGHGGGDEKKEEVVMELKELPPGLQNQLVKSIKRIQTNSVQGYSVTVCQPQCGKSTTKHPTTEHQHPTDPHPTAETPHRKNIFGGPKPLCFSADMTVTTPAGIKRMDQIRAGDKVLVASSESKHSFEKIEWLYHRDPNAVAEFVTITTKSQRVLRLSPNHLIPFVPCSNSLMKNIGLDTLADTQSYFARRLKVGHCIASLIDNEFAPDQIVDIVRETKQGIFSPITNRGTIVVNDMYVSCYSSFENHMIQKTVHSVIINTRNLVSKISAIFGADILPREDSNIPLPLQMLLKVAQVVLPSNL